MDILNKRSYVKRKQGDVVNGAELLEKVNHRLWKMRCECGEIFIAQPSHTNGRCRKCAYTYLSSLRTIHGESPKVNKRHASRLYRIWLGMKTRCSNSNNHSYKYYGGRGITMCEEWFNDYLAFKQWSLDHGYAENLTIDRIDVNGNYEPSNCRWITMSEQQSNKRKKEDRINA